MARFQLCGTVVAILCSVWVTTALEQSRPNVVFLMSDQHRWNAFNFTGTSMIQTPNFDRLAKWGAYFASAFTSTPSCTPARAGILTGLSPWYHGMLGYGDIAPHYNYTMPRAMSSAGFYAHSIGKDHFSWNLTTDAGIRHGYNSTDLYDGLDNEFDNYQQWFNETAPTLDWNATGLSFNDWRGRAYALPEIYHPTAWVGRRAVEWIAGYTSPDPFFLKVSFHRPHSPYDPPQRWMDVYNSSEARARLPPRHLCPCDNSTAVGKSAGGDTCWDRRYLTDLAACNPATNPDAWCGDPGEEDWRTSRAAYFGSVSFVDEWVGQVIEALEVTGQLNNTIILYSADHGDMNGDHYHWRKAFPFDNSAHIPMILSWPGADNGNLGQALGIKTPQGSIVYNPVELRDILPTVLDAADVAPSMEWAVNGSSLIDLLRFPSLQVGPRGTSAFLGRGNVGEPEKDHDVSLVDESTPTWREYVDLEHSKTYNVTNHWSALTDGEMLYVFNADIPSEMLFNTTADPKQMVDVSTAPAYSTDLELWRSRMVEQFEREGRGPQWVLDGKLQQRTSSYMVYGPNFPGFHDPSCEDCPTAATSRRGTWE